MRVKSKSNMVNKEKGKEEEEEEEALKLRKYI
jgi:hypothetical protein